VFDDIGTWIEDEPEDEDEEPRCAECGANLYSDEHAWDCSYRDDDEEDDENDLEFL